MALPFLAPLPDVFEQAACAGADPRLFDGMGTPEGRAICARCTIRGECAREGGNAEGLWGGMNVGERRYAMARGEL